MSAADERRWSIPADIERVGPLVLETKGFLEERGVGPRPLYRAQLLLEEIVSNVVRHGLRGDRSREVQVRVALDPAAISLSVVDEAPPFDLLRDAPAPSAGRTLQEIPEGGLGILLVKRMADELRYERRGGENHVIMRVDLG